MKHVSTFIFQGLFKNTIFRSVKLWAILDFFTKKLEGGVKAIQQIHNQSENEDIPEKPKKLRFASIIN